VVGFVKSNALESLYAPTIIGFGWESGAAAFCSIFKRRRELRLSQCFMGSKFMSNDLFVVWTTFCRRPRGGITAQVIADAIRELAILQQYLYTESGGSGIKILCIATGVPDEFIPEQERLLPNKGDLIKAVSVELGFERDTHKEWDVEGTDPQDRKEEDSVIGLRGRWKAPIGRAKSYDKPLPSPVERGRGRSWQEMVVSNPIDSSSLRSESSIRQSEVVRPSLAARLMTARTSSPEETILRLQNRPESWVSFRQAFFSSWSTFQKVTESRIMASLTWLHSADGPDCTTLFVPEHQSDVGALKEFKYGQIYDELNRVIIESQLRYQKNPEGFLSEDLHSDGDPLASQPVSCHVLYSGDYASSKLDSLSAVCKEVAQRQGALRTPASLTFVPDA
jgi:hypothetical protein